MIYTVTLNPAIDYVMHPRTLMMERTNRSSSEQLLVGGNGINVSTVLNECDVDNVALGAIAGFTGDYLLRELQDRGVTCNFIRLKNGFTRINVKLDGDQMTIINGVGPKITEQDLEELMARLNRIDKGDTLVLTGSIPKPLPENMYEVIMSRLSGHGIRFVVDAPNKLLLNAIDAKPFFVKPNNHEVGMMFDVDINTPEECLPYAHKLHDRGAENVIISCGGLGAVLVDGDGNDHIVPCPPSTLVNATGAGDSMVAGFIASIDRGSSYEEALRFSVSAGTATASSNGLARRATIQKFYESLCRMIDGE